MFFLICTLQAMDQKLLRELGTSGEGDPTEVQQLIDEVCFENS